MLEKQTNVPDIAEFLVYIFINEFQSAQNYPRYPLSNKVVFSDLV